MGRPPKRSTISYQTIEQTLREASNLAAPDYMPTHVDLLGYIIIALTERIGMVSPSEYALWRLIDVPNPPRPRETGPDHQSDARTHERYRPARVRPL